MLKVSVVFGTRPEAIKMAPIIHLLRAEPSIFSLDVCVTGQHREMLDQVLEVFGITPDNDLRVMRPGQGLAELTAQILTKMQEHIEATQPDLILVHGDTTTALATAIAAFYAGVPIGHVEAGLRTSNLQSPFPEEFNRQVISKISTLHFAPTELSRQNLVAEGVEGKSIVVTGNTVIDSLFLTLGNVAGNSQLKRDLELSINKELPFLWQKDRFVLITGHRRENFGNGLIEICAALRQLAIDFPKVHFVYPVHLNPNVFNPVHDMLGELENIHLIKPLDYRHFVFLLSHCYIVLTDSGGIQEEAPSLGKPVLVMRSTTERPEGVEAGTVKLVGTQSEKIIQAVTELLKGDHMFQKMTQAVNPYGDGQSAERIVSHLRSLVFRV